MPDFISSGYAGAVGSKGMGEVGPSDPLDASVLGPPCLLYPPWTLGLGYRRVRCACREASGLLGVERPANVSTPDLLLEKQCAEYEIKIG